MPLGIELAAAWTQTLSCQEISAEIERDFDFLSVSARDVPERHRSLRAVYERSWMLLSGEERSAIRRLSVFHGSFQREAAEQVAGSSLDLLSSLINKSFLHRSSTGRYEILETLRKYVAEKLAEDPPAYQETHRQHAEYYAAFLQAREAHLKGIRQIEALEEISDEIENIRLAWQHMALHGNDRGIDQSQESLYLYYGMRSWLHEGVEVFGRAVDRLRSLVAEGGEAARQKAVILARLLARQGYFCDRIGRYDSAREALQESLSIFRDLGIQDETAMPCAAWPGYPWIWRIMPKPGNRLRPAWKFTSRRTINGESSVVSTVWDLLPYTWKSILRQDKDWKKVLPLPKRQAINGAQHGV
jgi:tetratricopeptide (TPR) repeat protein